VTDSNENDLHHAVIAKANEIRMLCGDDKLDAALDNRTCLCR